MKRVLLLFLCSLFMFSCIKEQPNVVTSYVREITSNKAVSGGDVISDGGADVTSRGVCWSTSQSPTIDDNRTQDGSGPGEFVSNIENLQPNTTYYLRAYAINKEGVGYGEEKSFMTLEEMVLSMPVVVTSEVTNVTQNAAVCGGEVVSDGNAEVTARGICWSTSENPTIEDACSTDGKGVGAFISNMFDLSKNTTYYVRAYATNSEGTSYGEEICFTTLDENEIVTPVVITLPVEEITVSSAISGGNVTSDGGADVIARGICWSTSQNPTLNDNFTTDGEGTGVYTSDMTGLDDNTTYYVRAYATNSVGTCYGEEISFTTEEEIVTTAPKVTTIEVSDITEYTAICGGNVTEDGNADVTARGVCWSTSQNPTLEDSFTTDGEGVGEFTSNIVDLIENTTYYVRAYATNEIGTAYGEEYSFTTLKSVGLPKVTTKFAVNITQNSAECGGNVTDDGNSEVVAKGICWSTSPEPTIDDEHTVEGSGLGEFTSILTDLTHSTLYYVRAYATNSVGTAYGIITYFITKDDGTINGYEYVDLGLSVKWAAYNIGATSPTEYGDYFAWGEIEPKETYTEENSLTHGIYMNDIGGNPQYDAAAAKWGAPWRLPSREECEEIIADCTWEWVTIEGVNGYKVTGPNGNHVFFPAAGCMSGSNLITAGENGMYFSYKMCGTYVNFAYGFHFGDDYYELNWLYRCFGRSIRPVLEKK